MRHFYGASQRQNLRSALTVVYLHLAPVLGFSLACTRINASCGRGELA